TVYMSDSYRDIDFARSHGVTNTHLIPNGANEAEFGDLSAAAKAEFRTKYDIKADELLVVNVSNHTGEKGHTEMLLAFLLAPLRGATYCQIAGSPGGCSRRCKLIALVVNAIGRLTGRRARLLFLNRVDTIAAMKAADIFLFLSNIEASPLVLFESAAGGV